MASYTRYISSTGSDSASGQTEFEAWLTTAGLSALVATLLDGDRLNVYVKEGTTVAHASVLTVAINKSVQITFDVYGGLGQGGRAFINWTGGNTNLFTISGDFSSTSFGVTFNNLDITGNNVSHNIVNVDTTARCFVTISNCNFHHTSQGQGVYTNKGRGVFMNSTTYVSTLTVQDSRFTFLGTDAISAFGSNTMFIYNSTFKNIGDLAVGGGEGDGVTTHTNATAEVYGCYFEKCLQGGCYFTNMGGTNKVVRSFVTNCGTVGITQSTGGTGTGTGGKTIVSHCVVVQPDITFQMDDFGNGQTQTTSIIASPCVAQFGTTSIVNKTNTLKVYNSTLWGGYRGSIGHVFQVGDVAGSYHVYDMRNCIILGKANGSNQRLGSLLVVTGITTITMNYNTYWCTSSSIPFRINYGSATNGTFADWQSANVVAGGFWLLCDINSTFYTGATDNTTPANHIYGLPAFGAIPDALANLYLHPLNTSGKIGNTSGVDAGHTPSPSIDGRTVNNTDGNFYRGALGPMRVNLT